MADLMHEAAVKEADQMSPLLVYRLPLCAQFFLVILLLGSFWSAFTYILYDNLYNCSEDNGCLSCTITSTKSGSCSEISQSSLPMSSSCISFSPPNIYSDIDSAVGVDVINNLPDEMKQSLSPRFIDSFNRHRTAWDCFDENDLNQLESPDPDCIVQYFDNHYQYPGFAIASNLQGGDGYNEKYVIAAGIRLLQNLYCITALLHTSGLQTELLGQSTAFSVTDIVTGVEWQVFAISECILFGPDDSIGVLSPEVHSCDQHVSTLEEAHVSLLVIPAEYVVPNDEAVSDANRVYAGEAMRLTIDSTEFTTKIATGQSIADDVKHCIEATSLANSYSTYETGLYRCCTEASFVEILSQAGAFASLSLTLAVIVSTILLYAFQQRLSQDTSLMKKVQPCDIGDDVESGGRHQHDSNHIDDSGSISPYEEVSLEKGEDDFRPAAAVTVGSGMRESEHSAASVTSINVRRQRTNQRHTVMGTIEENRMRRSSLTTNAVW